MFFLVPQKLYKEWFSIQSVQEGRKRRLVSSYTAKNFIYVLSFFFSNSYINYRKIIQSRAETKYSNEDREVSCFGSHIGVQMSTHLEQGNMNSMTVKM
jgi:hypothetical protein